MFFNVLDAMRDAVKRKFYCFEVDFVQIGEKSTGDQGHWVQMQLEVALN